MSGECVTLCADLIFGTRISGTAAQLNAPIKVVGTVEAALAAIGPQTTRLIVDLAAPASDAELETLQQTMTAPNAKSVAFGSHVDADRLNAARAAGFDDVLPRSEFVKRLASYFE